MYHTAERLPPRKARTQRRHVLERVAAFGGKFSSNSGSAAAAAQRSIDMGFSGAPCMHFLLSVMSGWEIASPDALLLARCCHAAQSEATNVSHAKNDVAKDENDAIPFLPADGSLLFSVLSARQREK